MRQKIREVCRAYRACEAGGTGIEYALIAGGVGLIVMASVQAVGIEARTSFDNVATEFANANAAP